MPAAAIQTEIDKLFPDDRVAARAVGGSIVLTGSVGSIVRVQEVEDVAMGYLRSPQFAELGQHPHVINMLSLKTAQQVQHEFKFAEVNRRTFREMGSNINGVRRADHHDAIGGMAVGDNATANMTSERSNPQLTGGSSLVRAMPTAGSFGTFFFGTQFGSFPFTATLSMLAQHNLSRTLAEPTLVAMVGSRQTFSPVADSVSDGVGDTSIEFKALAWSLCSSQRYLVIAPSNYVHRSLCAPDHLLAGAGGIETFAFKRRSSDTTVRLRMARVSPSQVYSKMS